nr:RES family NAD+ phosphorylase [Conexibacter arvalis]
MAEPGWADPLDTSWSRRAGGRWNARGSYGVLYLNGSDELARLQVAHKLAGQPFGVEDLDPSEQHDLVRVDVADREARDCVTADGLAAVGLPASYPRDHAGDLVGHERCQPLGADARDDGLAGVLCRSAAGRGRHDHELALFDSAIDAVTQGERLPFDRWYWGARS